MEDSEVVDFINESKAGVLCLIDGDRPYGVPLEHLYQNNCLYFAVGARESRKLKSIEGNPRACYVIYESIREKPEIIEKGGNCRSLILEGTVTLTGVKEIKLDARKARLRVLKFNIEKIGNWTCPAASCPVKSRDPERSHQLLLRYPELLEP